MIQIWIQYLLYTIGFVILNKSVINYLPNTLFLVFFWNNFLFVGRSIKNVMEEVFELKLIMQNYNNEKVPSLKMSKLKVAKMFGKMKKMQKCLETCFSPPHLHP